MRTTLFITLFAALAAAAPESTLEALIRRESEPEGLKRCGGGKVPKDKSLINPRSGSDWDCLKGQTCVGEYRFKDSPQGVCMDKPTKCGGGDGPCPSDGLQKCIPVSNTRICPQDVAVCGHCVSKKDYSQYGLRSEGTNLCKGSSGKECFANENHPEVCAGEGYLKGSGVCLEWGFLNSCPDGKCSLPNYHCVDITCPKGIDPELCNKKVCLADKYVKELGLASGVTPATIAVPPPVKPSASSESKVSGKSASVVTKTSTRVSYNNITRTVTKTTTKYKTSYVTVKSTRTVTKNGKPNRPTPRPRPTPKREGYGGGY
ncbi:hypothetical protein TWF718_000379 [Orbilia javanica]|uniref:Uncharacterized protein n=1 Tax=Orbilia javanica TaxID=47235 RepID=A0AAN8N4A0_9PEZI